MSFSTLICIGIAVFAIGMWWDMRQWRARQDAMRKWDKEHPEFKPFQGTQEEYEKWRQPKYQGDFAPDISALEKGIRGRSAD